MEPCASFFEGCLGPFASFFFGGATSERFLLCRSSVRVVTAHSQAPVNRKLCVFKIKMSESVHTCSGRHRMASLEAQHRKIPSVRTLFGEQNRHSSMSLQGPESLGKVSVVRISAHSSYQLQNFLSGYTPGVLGRKYDDFAKTMQNQPFWAQRSTESTVKLPNASK